MLLMTFRASAAEIAEFKFSPSKGGEEPVVTISVEGIFLKDILRVLSEQTGFSYVASEELETRKISLSLDNVPIREALRSIAVANNLRIEQIAGSKVVLFCPGPSNEISKPLTQIRVFHLKYTRLSISPMEIGGNATIQDLKAQVALSNSTTNASDSTSSSTSTSSTTSTSAPATNLTVAKGVDQMVASLLTPNGKVTIDLHSNSLIVTDTPKNLDEIEIVLNAIDRPSAQVSIEVYLMEVQKNILTDHGVDWGGTNGALASLTGGSRTTGFPFTESIFNNSQGAKATTQGASTLTLGTLSATNFTATLRFLTSDSRTKILARPRVLTLNNEAANIKLVTNAAIADTTSTTTAEGTAISSSHTAERTEVGIVLKMTPQINEDESIGLFVEPSVTTVAASSFFPTTFQDPTTRTVRTMARVQNDQTLVIGGLLDRNDSLTAKKIPFLGDIPLLGYAFKYNDGNDLDRELLIFITPHIVNEYDVAGASEMSPTERRVLSNYIGEEMDKQLDSIENVEAKSRPVLIKENQLRQKSARPALTQAAAKEMALSLDSLNGKK